MRGIWHALVERFGYPKLFITIFLVTLITAAVIQGQDTVGLLRDVLVRVGMNGVLVLAMVPSIVSGAGPNFALSIGIVCGVLGGCVSIELGLVGLPAFLVAALVASPIAAVAGYFYGQLLNRVKGEEMTVATYMGFSVVSLMCIAWLVLPFKSPEMVWAIGGKGLRTTITLAGRFDKVLDNLIDTGRLDVPLGTLLFFGALCGLMWIFLRSRAGAAMMAAGENPRFAHASGIGVDKERLIGTVMSMVLGAVGILVYAQSYGFFQLYTGPLMMPFAAVSAILIGGATAKRATIANVVSGVVLFQGLLTISLPVINQLMPEGNLSEVMRIIVSNGVILYALTRVGSE